jgi:hypothetical protein
MEINFNRNSAGGADSKNRFFVFAGILILVVVLAVGVLVWLQG